MNERIKELLDLANIKFDKDINEIDICLMLPSDLGTFAELVMTRAFRLGVRHAAKKYRTVGDERFTGNDVALFLEMEAVEVLDEEIKQQFDKEPIED